MTDENVARRLAAILVGDVAGYSRLMAADESTTVRMLGAYREEVAMLVRQHGGCLENFTGDAFLAYFSSAVGAVVCALEIQRVIAARNADVPEDRRMRFRIGAHLGELRMEGERVFGNGPNIAARLEKLAEPGGLCLSATLVEQVEGKVETDFRNLGERTLKNIPQPVRAFAAVSRGTVPSVTQASDLSRAAVITTFANLSSNVDDAYLARGLTEDLATLLVSTPDFKILPRLEARSDTGVPLEALALAQRLGAGYAISGSVRRVHDRIRVAAHLVDAKSEAQVWGERYDRSYADLFEVQDEIADAIAKALDMQLWQAEFQHLRRAEAANLDAWGLVQRAVGTFIAGRVRREALRDAEGLLRRALEVEPDYALAQATLALVLGNQVRLLYSENQERDVAESLELGRSAAEREPNDPRVAFRVGGTYLRVGRADKALPLLERSVRMDPNWLPAQADLGQAQVQMAEIEEGLARLQDVVTKARSDLQLNLYELYLAVGKLVAGEIEDAESALRRSLQAWDQLHITWFVLALPLALRGRFAEAREAMARARELEPAIALESYEHLLRLAIKESEPLIEVLRQVVA